MRDLDLKSLRLLVAACDHQNIKLAAEQAHIEPSAVSKRIAQLEEQLKTPLLVRGRRGVAPTAAGLALLEHARNLLFTADRIEADLASFRRFDATLCFRELASLQPAAARLVEYLAARAGTAPAR